ncbi:MAG: hypothetical protein KHW59_00700 [Clostridiales bacterium]|nr:hypothetical protein [Clostridiales bacterium]
MKKVFSVLFALLLTMSMFAGCSNQTGDNGDTSAQDTTASTDTTAGDSGEYTLGMGVVVDTSDSKDGTAQAEATFAAVITDDNGKIVDCYIDTAQNKMSVADGIAEKDQTYQTKQELGADYGMKDASGIGKEWNEQADFFAGFVKGMTGAEVSAINTEENDAGTMVAADEDLYAGCTIGVTEMIQAVAKACSDDQAYAFHSTSSPQLQFAAVTEDSSSKDATDEADGLAAMYTTFAAAVEDDGRVLACCVDEIEPKISFTIDGAISEIQFDGSKRELKEDYGMKDASGIGKEWYEQARAFADYVVGKTPAEAAGIETQQNDSGALVAKDEDLYAGCTIGIDSFVAVLAKALEK